MGFIENDLVLDGRKLKHGDSIRLFYLNHWVYGTVDTFLGSAYLVGENIKQADGVLLEVNMQASFIPSDQKGLQDFKLTRVSEREITGWGA